MIFLEELAVVLERESWNNENLNRFQSELKNFLSEMQNSTPSPAPTTLAGAVNNPVTTTGNYNQQGQSTRING
jgi:hypothetical protein